ncbi:MAG: ABC transporter permease [Acidobacteria bacterium]|nr:ABC transporter permease [Acidobacteriota bacterium]
MLARIRSLAARLLRRPGVDAALTDEIESHLAHRADHLVQQGLPRAQAEVQARREFGRTLPTREECVDEMGGAFLHSLLQDTRFSTRALLRSPGFTLVAITTLALAIAANAVVFGVINGILLRPLNVPDPKSLYGIEQGSQHSMYMSYPDFLDLRERNRSFEDLAGFTIHMAGIDAGSGATRAWAIATSANYFDALHVKPFLGRLFHQTDDRGRNSAPYIVLAHDYWRTHFQSDPTVVGRVVRLNRHPFTIIGVAQPGFRGVITFLSPSIFVPLIQQGQLEAPYRLDSRATHTVFMSLGHLRPGVTPHQAVSDLNAVGAWFDRTYPKDHNNTTFKVVNPGLYGNYLGQPMRAFVTGLAILASLILLAACANLGSLFAARASDRSREVALRLSLGASRGRILRQLFTEAMLLSLAGGALGLWISTALLRALSSWQPLPKYPILIPVQPDEMVYLSAIVLALLSGALFALVPVRQVLQTNPYQVVKAGPGQGKPGRLTLRDVLLGVQIAICSLLVTSSVVAVRGLANSLDGDMGFDRRGAFLGWTDLTMAGYNTEQIPAVQKRLYDALKSVPGAESVAFANPLPLSAGMRTALIFTDQTTDLRAANALANAYLFAVSPDYFTTVRTPLTQGREFTWLDSADSPKVAVINEELARLAFGSPRQALGNYFKTRVGHRYQVVGIARNGKYANLTEDFKPALFLCTTQSPGSEVRFVVRARDGQDAIAGTIRETLHREDSALPVEIESWNTQLDFALFPSRMAALTLGVLGIIGSMLTVSGIFGLAAYSVSRRLKELGIRIALGARAPQVLQTAVGRVFRILALGAGAGLVLGALASNVLAAIVYQASPRDPLVVLCAVAVMATLGIVAAWVPAQRALSADPLRLLREE